MHIARCLIQLKGKYTRGATQDARLIALLHYRVFCNEFCPGFTGSEVDQKHLASEDVLLMEINTV